MISDRKGRVVYRGKTDNEGKLMTELLEYRVEGGERNYFSPYTIVADRIRKKIDLVRNTEIILK
jgi:hypothetical protein